MQKELSRKSIVSMLAVLFVFASLSYSLGEQDSWDCPDCGRTGNKGNYCGECGHPAPWIESESAPTPALSLTLHPNAKYLEYKTLSDGTIEITGINGDYPRSFEIPQFIDGKAVTIIGDKAFSNCNNLKDVTIPNSVTSIGYSAFRECKEMMSVTIPESTTKIGSYAFSGCCSLTNVTIPDSVTRIDNHAFNGCSSLTSVTIPDSVTIINDHAFNGCSSLKNVTISNSVTYISFNTFSDCSNLTSVMIPETVTKIDKYAFSGCSNLTSVTIPDSVTRIGDAAFVGCCSLTNITLLDSVNSIGPNAFNECEKLVVKVPQNSFALWYCMQNGIQYEIMKNTNNTMRMWSGDPTTVGSSIIFGHYEQDNDFSNGAEIIEWVVLEYNAVEQKCLLISRYGLDVHVFDSSHMISADKNQYPSGEVNTYPGWAESDIRLWLNDSFLNVAFSSEEQKCISDSTVTTTDCRISNRASWEPEMVDGGKITIDKLFLLSENEAFIYFRSDERRKCILTKYAEACGANKGFCWWLLRSPVELGVRWVGAISDDGSGGAVLVTHDYMAIRPAFWLDLDSENLRI